METKVKIEISKEEAEVLVMALQEITERLEKGRRIVMDEEFRHWALHVKTLAEGLEGRIIALKVTK